MRILLCLASIATLTACAPPPQSEEEKLAAQAAAFRVTARECTIYLGGVDGIREMQQKANAQEAAARSLGATDAVVAAQSNSIQSRFNLMEGLVGKQEACSEMVNLTVANL